MKKGLTYLICIVTTLFLYSCNNANNQMQPKEIDIIIDVDPGKAVESIQISELYTDIKYVPLETNDNSLIGNISDIIKFKDRFYILDNDITQSVFCFTETGKFLFKINRIGTGPGEYIRLAAFSIDTGNEQLLLHDTSTKQILHFSLDGDYIESHKIGFEAYRFSYISDGYFAFYCDFNSNKEFFKKGKYPNLIITDRNFKVYKTGMEYSEDANFPAIPKMVQCFNRYDPKTLLLIPPLNDTIFHVSKVGASPYLHINFKNNQRKKEMDVLMNTPEPDLEINAIVDFLKNNSICDLFYFVESTQKVFFAYSRYPSTHYVFYDKVSKDLKDIVFKRGKQFPIINDIDRGDFTMPMISDGNLFYSVITPDMLLEKKEDILVSNAPKKQNVLELISQISEDDNPIIAIITPK